jgi:hypothetical protein
MSGECSRMGWSVAWSVTSYFENLGHASRVQNMEYDEW